MLIAYASRTGNVRRFIEKLGMRSLQVDENTTVQEPFVLVTYTTGFGQVPEQVKSFLDRNSKYLKAVSASGNRNWGQVFAASADSISRAYGVPVLHKFELSGTQRDVAKFVEGVNLLASH
ncbi:class Ib ribonucleoside-diphosphate reductase assembly flavoprotein NrdI [Paenibacillus thermoaerophilus]|uniref:Protein NrdI n=1 Tax=Paenibacillus thermoaerophilus TaxID=1215385 RepID=A0ABW2V1Q2_9BACL|nr:class Ib ribonucleoside-diphosphate reductase assembly flavoprotein NrdI [Paenibacillus thermoaerophilus]TMV17427.1 class Ib ribonucleoside-diphosphate reductase assembly flavoprotein NrdI [Paenibacillus thermoaerophilus]